VATILVVDDDADFRDGLVETLTDLGHRIVEAASGKEAMRLAGAVRPDAAFLDLRMPDMDGLAALRALRDGNERLPFPVVILTAYASSANTIEAMRLGAFDHLTKPVGRDDIRAILDRILTRACDGDGAPAPQSPLPSSGGDDGDALIGSSDAIRDVQKLIGLAADSDATVLVTGETGTGKELAARALHRFSRRSGRPFVAVNCAAIPADLLESELFGHVRGAFTGAVSDRRGRFRDAQGGTLFLDEIGDMDVAMQAKILRVLQERAVVPVGGSRPEPVDVRIVAATHRDLPALICAGRFREDLYYRLNVIPIALPPLRERLSDILPLAEHFLRLASGPQAAPKRLSAAAAARLLAHSWPGNVRELRNLMERLAVIVRGSAIDAPDLGLPADGPSPAAPSPDTPEIDDLDLPAAVARLERSMIRRALHACGGNRAQAARRLGINRQFLYEKIKRYGVEDG
jgi:DNA-binding NtrC family response regulator